MARRKKMPMPKGKAMSKTKMGGGIDQSKSTAPKKAATPGKMVGMKPGKGYRQRMDAAEL